MRGRLLNLPALARAVGFALVAIAIIAATLHFREAPLRSPDHAAGPAATSNPLSDELKRCQLLASEAKDDAACEAAWDENRRRFFTYQPPSTTAPPAASAKSPDR
jgi:conjugative transfer region protein TrbK